MEFSIELGYISLHIAETAKHDKQSLPLKYSAKPSAKLSAKLSAKPSARPSAKPSVKPSWERCIISNGKQIIYIMPQAPTKSIRRHKCVVFLVISIFLEAYINVTFLRRAPKQTF